MKNKKNIYIVNIARWLSSIIYGTGYINSIFNI